MARMQMLARDGVVWVEITDDLEAIDIASHWNAVWRYVRAGDPSALQRHERAGVGLHEFETDPDEIDSWVLLTTMRSVEGKSDDRTDEDPDVQRAQVGRRGVLFRSE